ncbi:hypothetical protein VNO78_10961 [Psophocarpus tetragonolobus]|uniref:Protein kinase domain-containing protein n=1 Tax=Psophocarpus tetragonolobus TaxID=3891 RepID=A0AAN9SNC7_PSOTE
MLSLKIRLTTVIVLSIVFVSIASYAETSLDIEIQALKAFKNFITDDPNGALVDWVDRNTTATGLAFHVTRLQIMSSSGSRFEFKLIHWMHSCSQLSLCTQLSKLFLFENSLSGPIPPELGNLKSLQYFDLGGNFLNGSIPDSIFNCTSLLGMAFSFNNLTGIIPSNIGNLVNVTKIIGFGNNLIVGSIPPKLGNLVQLETLRLYGNNLNSTIPASIFQLKSLRHLGLSENILEGTISEDIGSLHFLHVLTLHLSKFTGRIPSSITNLTNLTYLSMSQNFLSGELPSNFTELHNLKAIFLGNNFFHGSIPSSIANCTSLVNITLSFNALSGRIPEGFSRLPNLTFLSLASNKLTGEIPDDLYNCSNLSTLSLGENNFSGLIKSRIRNLSKLQLLQLNVNSFIGPTPPEIGNLSQLITLALSENKFSGQIPPQLPKLSRLQGLGIHDTLLEGTIPDKLSELKDLTKLLLYQNKLVGQIPDSISKLEMLSHLDLHGNKLSGFVPRSMGQLNQLLVLDLSHNQLTGSIPGDVIAHLKDMQINLFNLDFSGNNVSGPIPAEAFSHMGLLESLNLSRNHLEGEIPEILAELGHLSSLYLSQTDLKGTIPEGFANLSSLVHLNLSFNQLAVLLLVLVILIFKRGTKLCNFKERDISVNQGPEYSSTLALKRLDPKDLENATGFFSTRNIIGASRLSTVYKVEMEDGQVVALKILNLQQFTANTDNIFKREANTLSQMRHRNLVKILGYAWESGKMKALVLEYVENGNLDSIIHGKGVDQTDGSTISSSAALEGTVGYIAPEFAYMGKVTTKADVFSFGIIVMECLTKRRPTELSEEDGLPIPLREVVTKALANGKEQVANIVDPLLTWNVIDNHDELLSEFIRLSLCCTLPDPEHRPYMNEVLSSLVKLQTTLMVNTTNQSLEQSFLKENY